MAYSYEEWKRRNNNRKKPSIKAPIFSEFKARYQAERDAEKPKQEHWQTVDQWRYDSQPKTERARQTDADRFAARYAPDTKLNQDLTPKTEKSRQADADRFSAKYTNEKFDRPNEKARRADSDRFAGRYTSEQNRKDLEILDVPNSQKMKYIDRPATKKEEKSSLLSRILENAKKPFQEGSDVDRMLSDPKFHQRNLDMERKGESDMIKGFFDKDTENDTLSGKAGANLRLGTGDAIESVAGGMRWLMAKKTPFGLGEKMPNLGADLLQKGADGIREGFEDDAFSKEFEHGDWNNPEWIATQLPRAIPQMLTSLIPGLAVGAATGRLSKIQKLPKLFKTIIPPVAGGGTMAAIDATMEAGGVYDEAVRRGMTEDEANDAANEAFKHNIALNTGMDVAQFLLMFTPLRKIDGLGKLPSIGIRAGGYGLAEGFQEVAQTGITANALGDEFSLTDPSTMEAGLLGLILGTGVSGVATSSKEIKDSFSRKPTINSPVTDILNKAVDEMPQEIRTEFDQAVTDLEEQGMPKEEAMEVVSEQLLDRVPVFGEVLTEKTKEYIADKKLEQQSTELNPITKEQEDLEEAQVAEQTQVTEPLPIQNEIPQAPLDTPIISPEQIIPVEPPLTVENASLDMPNLENSINTPEVIETPVQASNDVLNTPVDVQVGDTVNLEGTRAETEYVVEGVEDNHVQVLTPNRVSIKVPKRAIVNVLNREALQEDVQMNEVIPEEVQVNEEVVNQVPEETQIVEEVQEPEVMEEVQKTKEPYLTPLFEDQPVPKVSYKETKTRVTATFKPNRKYWHKEEPAEMTLTFSKDKDGYLRTPKHNGSTVSVADINDWMNLNYYQEGVHAKDLVEAFDNMNSTHKSEQQPKTPQPKAEPKKEESYTVIRYENGVPVYITGTNYTKDGAESYANSMNKTNSHLVNGATYKIEVTTKELEKQYADEKEEEKKQRAKEKEEFAKQQAKEKEVSKKPKSPPKAEPKAEPTNVKADDKYAKMRDRLEFADKAAAAARKRLESRRNTLYSGLPMNDYVDLSIIGMTKLAHKMVDLAEFTEQMVKEFGESRRVWIPGVYAQATAMLDYDEAVVEKMLQDAYGDETMTLTGEEESQETKESETNVSDTDGTGSVSDGTPTESTPSVEKGGTTEEVSPTGGKRNNGSDERKDEPIVDGVPDKRGEQPKGSTGDTVTSPSNHGNPNERVIPVDHVITENIYEPNAKKRFENNIKALEVLKTLETENRHGTASELEVLAKYQGWGGLPEYFDRSKPQFASLDEHVKTGLITKEEYEAMRKTVNTSFYTSHEIAKKMYHVLLNAGFNGGKILESSVGTGMFLGAFPQIDGKHKFTTVEIDGLSHRITSKLYPNQKHHHKGFQQFSADEGSFDVVIGNVPFSTNKILDKTYSNSQKGTKKDKDGNRLPKGKIDHKGRLMTYATHNTHDYFLVKNLDLLKEGGLGILITSSSSLDGSYESTYVREYLEANTDFFEAIRLPDDAFKHAGTSVTTDILFFRKKVKDSKSKPTPFINVGILDGELQGGRMNEYFITNPEQVTGGLKKGTRFHNQILVTMDNFENRLKKAVSHVTKVFKNKFIPGGANETIVVPGESFINEDWAKEKVGVFDGAIHARNGAFIQYSYNQWKMYKVEKENVQKLKDTLAVRDAYLALIVKEEDKSLSSDQMIKERKALNETYDKFVKAHGNMNKKGVLTPFENDVRTVALLRSLEKAVGKKWEKVDLFKARQKFPDIVLEKKGDIQNALNLSLIHRGELDLNVVADLLEMSKEDAIDKLEKGGHIFFDPQEQAYVTDDEYLSGNIAKKLALAKEKDLQKNIAALEKILPTQLTIEQIIDGIRFGQGWIPKEVYKEFIEKTLDLRGLTITHNFHTASWGIKVGHNNYSHKNTEKYAIKHPYAKKDVQGVQIIENLMNLKSPKPPLDLERIPGTAIPKAREEILNITNRVVLELENEFKAFVIGHPTYNEQLTKMYNDTFTSVVPRLFDGERMYGPDENPVKIPNLNPIYKLYKHQKDAVMRVLRSQNSLLAHVVGAGKTLEMQVAIMEGRRLGIIKKPMLVVPLFMIEQHAREFQHAYPNAKIKVITTGKTENDIAGVTVSRNAKWSDEQYELETEKNRALRFRSLADVKYGDYDVVIMSYNSFERISLDPENEKEFVHREVETLRSFMEEMVKEDGKSPSVKEIEKAIEKLETRLEELKDKDKKDVAMSFEEIGIDALFVDEAQSYKNLQYHTKLGSIGGLPNSTSKRAFDMYMKTFVMNKQGGKTVFATGTPISNSMAEMYTLLRYLAPDVLEQQGMAHFDGWAQLFGTTENSVELNTAGKFVERTRFSKFTNVGELMRIFKSFADIKMADDLPYLKRPQAERITIKTGMSEKQKTFLELMVLRASYVDSGRVEATMDNLLKLTGEGKKLALDYRMFDGKAENDPNSKLNRIAEEVVEEYKANTKGNEGIDPKTGEPITFDNATQIVFMDLGVPKASDKKNEDDNDGEETDASMYQNLKDRLIELGVKNEHIAFIHDYNKPEQKKKLSNLFNDGEIRVLIGSTGKMGVGMNLQKRLHTLHHVDPTWRPSDIEQREGRLIRQGNFNPNVKIKTYVTEGSFDALMWNTLENKAKFIAQVMSGGTEIRSMEEIAEQIMSFSEIKAEATGNQSVIDLIKTEKEIRRLTGLQQEHSKRKGKATKIINDYEQKKTDLNNILNFSQRLEGKAKSTRGEKFHLVLGEKTFTDRTEGTKALRDKVLEIRKEERKDHYFETIGELGGVPLLALGQKVPGRQHVQDTLLLGEVIDGSATGYGWIKMEDFVSSEGRGGMSRLENVVIGLSSKTYSPTTIEKLADLEVAYKDAKKLLAEPYEDTSTLRQLEADVITLREQALQHELTSSFNTVFTKDGKEYVVAAIDYREVPSKNKKKQKEDKPDYELDVVFSEIVDINHSKEPDVFGINNETEYEIYNLGDSDKTPIIDFIRDFDRVNSRKGVTETVAEQRRVKAEQQRKEDEENRKKEDPTGEGISELLDTNLSGGTDIKVSPKTAKKVGDLLANALDTVLHSGYVESKRGKRKNKQKGDKVLGTYNFNKGSGNIRAEHIHDLRVVAHELGHAFEQYVGLDEFESIKDELEKVAVKLYPNGAELTGDDKMKEGLAELIQLYVIDPVASEQLAPSSYRFLQEFIDGDPTLKKAFDESSKIISHELDGTVINKALGSINFADDTQITKNIGDEYSVRGGDNATRRQKIKGFIKEQLFELVDFKIPFKDMRKELKKQGFKGLDIVKKLSVSGSSRERARHEFISWASDKYGRKIINYQTVEELPTFLQDKYDELISGVFTGDHDYVKRFKRFMKTDPKERAALKALSSRSFQEISVDGINHVEESLRKRKDIPRDLQEIIDRLDTTIDGKKKKVPSYRIFSAIAQSYRYKERSERLDENGNKKFINNPINESEAERLIAFSRKTFPDLENLIEEYTHNLSEVILTKSVEGGLITEKTKEIVKKGSRFYIPTYYASQSASLDGTDSDRKAAGQPLQRYKGKQEIVLDVLQATTNKLLEVEAAVEFKGIMDILQDSLKTKGMGKFGSFITPSVVPTKISGKQIEPQLIDFISEETGVDASDMEGSLSNAVFSIYVKAGDKFKSHEPILVNWTYDNKGNAKRTYMKVAPDLYNSIVSMQPLQFGLYLRTLSQSSSVFRYLALANLKYLITAFQRDLSTAYLQRNSKGGMYTYIKNTLKGVAYAAGVDQKVVDQYMASGAFSSNPENVLRSFSRKNVTDGLLPTKDPSLWKLKSGKLVKLINPSAYLSWGESIFRFGEFNATVNEMLAEEGIMFSYEDFMDGSVKLDKKDLPTIERILLEAGHRASEITVNFNNHGRSKAVQKVTNPISFLHGAVQGLYREAEEIKEHGFNKASKRLAYRTMGTMLPMTLAVWALSRAFGEDEEEIPSDMRDRYWMIWTPFGYYAWAKPFTYSIPDAYIERFLDDALGEDGARKYNEDILNPLRTLWHLPYMPILFSTMSDLYHNETWYGGEIVPHYKEEGPDYQEFDENTSTLAKKQAELMFKYRNKLEGVKDPKDANYEYGISPKKFDYAITSLFGKWGAAFLEIAGGKPKKDMLGFGSMVTTEDEIRSRSVDKFYKKAQQVEDAHKTFGEKYKPDKETKMYRKFSDSMKHITELQKEVNATESLTSKQKTEILRDLTRAKRDIARFGIEVEVKDRENVVKILEIVEKHQNFLDSQKE